MAKRAELIEHALKAAFAPEILEVIDESEAHRGHAGFQDGGESHFRVKIRSAHFAGQSRIARHRAVHGALGAELITAIHALALDIDVP